MRAILPGTCNQGAARGVAADPVASRRYWGYLRSEKTGNGVAAKTTVALTGRGREALDSYRKALSDLLGGL